MTTITEISCTHSVARTIRVTGMSGSECEQTIRRGLHILPGVREARAEHRTGRVWVSYDLGAIRLQALEERLAQLGYPPKNGFGARIQRAWIYFTEQNRRDNLTHRGHCCNKPPGA
uniref:Copper chaperone CopZ n=1 Tax=Candidatus Kentrum sp. MB TaxID=2138164 RepID=A0A450XJD5_9GAMM|nr:MAG: Copper chaperone CopZ [Candidatus Kentron sp. MB]VFK29440.1 MAG: Copper chaperone CopZ [Candidatus Kentron sp. MB]VFK74779.1 MAG: Copper chaperone CopZ [Candidatus Kentron sp. MB]